MDMNTINWLAVLVAGVSAFILGGIWYSPALFGKSWMIENSMTVEDVQKGNKGKIFGWSFILSLLMSANLAMFLADPAIDFSMAIVYGLLTGVWIFCGIAIVSLFEHKSARYIFINGGYMLVALGQIAHVATARALQIRPSAAKFGHCAEHVAADGRVLLSSYHCSRYNQNTGRLDAVMFERVFERACEFRSG